MLLFPAIAHLTAAVSLRAVPAAPVLAVVFGPDQSPACVDSTHCRSIFDIVRSCVFVVFGCTWLTMHPNVPAPDQSKLSITSRRAALMLLAVVTPEFVVLWAIKQWLVARKLAAAYQYYGWTQTHGFMLIMGGFMLFEGSEPIETLSPAHFKLYLERGEVDITKREIDDKSKGDALAKGLVLVQIAWFVLQSIARGVQRLPITELEVVVLAYSMLSFITYFFWWNKPLNVTFPVRVKRNPHIDDRKTSEHIESEVATYLVVASDTVGQPSKAHSSRTVRGLSHATRAVLYPTRKLFSVMARVVSNQLTIKPHATRAPTLYGGELELTDDEILHVGLAAETAAALFGGIHCIAWCFAFPSRPERDLWRTASIAITCLPMLPFAHDLARLSHNRAGLRRVLESRFLAWVYVSLGIVGIGMYILARATLLVLAFISLRSLPPGGLRSVSWTKFIPHI